MKAKKRKPILKPQKKRKTAKELRASRNWEDPGSRPSARGAYTKGMN